MIKPIALCVNGILMVTTLTGCGSMFGPEDNFRDRGDDYLKADVIDPIKMPDGSSGKELDQLYVIPEIATENLDVPSRFEVPRPQVLSDNAFSDRVKIQKLEDRRWVLVSAAPTVVWPQVRGFLSRNNLEVVYTDAKSGVIETGWLKFTNDEETQNKYRLVIEQGIQPDSTEIHVLHLSVPLNSANTNVKWPSKSTDADREAWMVDELAGVIASDTSGSQAASLLAQTIGLSDKVVLKADGDEPVLHLSIDYSRATATVAQALDKEGFTFWEQHKKPDLFFVHYTDVDPATEEEPGFFSRLFGGSKTPEEPVAPYTIAEILANLQLRDNTVDTKIFSGAGSASGGTLPKSKMTGYLVVMSGQDQNIEVRIRDSSGRLLDKAFAKKLLSIIRHNLI